MSVNPPVDIIIPVYDGFDQTVRCIDSVLASDYAHDCEIIIINDGSPNQKLTDYLMEHADTGKFTLLTNEKNLGFVATVNKGMRLHEDRDVVLVNSDTIVANNWLDRLYECAISDDAIATVTPFSNNAEICSFPVLCKSNELVGDKSVSEIDSFISKYHFSEPIFMPTAVGFCMYIKRSALEKVGYFDEEAFGRGYGEENDFCLRCEAVGLRHALCTNVFVFHEGGVSFSHEKLERVENAMQILDKKYPHYHRLVHEHIQQDPARHLRQKIQLDMLAEESRRTILFMTHDMGGGIQTHINEMQAFFSDKINILVLKPNDEEGLELCFTARHFDLHLFFSMRSEFSLLVDTLVYLGVERIHIHHVMRMPVKALELPRILALPYDVTLHDYYFINANPTLTDKQGVFVEDPKDRPVKCAESYPLPTGYSLSSWQAFSRSVLDGAKRIFSPSKACAQIYNSYFPHLSITVAYHPDAEMIKSYPAPYVVPVAENEKLRIAVIGAVSREKGADKFEHTACHRDPLDRLEFHLIGYAYKPMRETITSHGAYKNDELQGLIEQINPHVIWFPAQWPETYCYVLSSALESGRPIMASNLGSFEERLAGRPLSYIRRWNDEPEQWKNAFIELREWMLEHSHEQTVWDNCASGDAVFRYAEDFIVDTQPSARNLSTLASDMETMRILSFPHGEKQEVLDPGKREKLLRFLLLLREKPVIRTLVRLIPFELQRTIKRKLSRKPIHDVMNS